MKIKKTNFKDLYLIKYHSFNDLRGELIKIHYYEKLKKYFSQIKQVIIVQNKKKNTFRGFHFQKKPFEESKIIYCIEGKIKMFCIDMRKKSKTYKKSFTTILSSKYKKSILIPRGFANGYLTKIDNTKIVYLIDNNYIKKSSTGFNYKSKFVNIRLPKEKITISSNDKKLKILKNI